MMFAGWMGFVLLAVAAVFGYHLWLGWRTRVVRFPMSVLTLEEFEYERSPANYWGVMAADLVGFIAAAGIAAFVIWNSLIISTKPIDNLRTLNGCYEGQGTPDFMRPQIHWALRIENGLISNRDGATVARLRLVHSTPDKTAVAFSPGILISSDERKITMVYVGDTTNGYAYINGGRPIITLSNDWGDVLLRTACE